MPPLDLRIGEVYQIGKDKNKFCCIVAQSQKDGRYLLITNWDGYRTEWTSQITNTMYQLKGNVNASHE